MKEIMDFYSKGFEFHEIFKEPQLKIILLRIRCQHPSMLFCLTHAQHTLLLQEVAKCGQKERNV
jgi:hypothetical protein